VKDILEAQRLPDSQEDAPLPLLQDQPPFAESMGIKRKLPQVADWQIGESVKQGEVDWGVTGVTTRGE
jgi:hypothetical protein